MKRTLSFFLLLFSSCYSVDSFEDRTSSPTITSPIEAAADASDLKIYLPYVGQGDATLIQLPHGKVLLIDAGPKTSGPGPLLNLLKELNIKNLAGVILTHYDADHIGGFAPLVAGEDGMLGTEDDLQVDKVYDRGEEPWDRSPEYPRYLEAIQTLGIPRISLFPGDLLDIDPGVTITCMAANGQVLMGQGIQKVDLSPATYTEKENAASVSVLLEFGEIRYLTSGDLTGGGSINGFLTPDIETLLAEAVGEVDLLHVNHHGSRSSSNSTFVTATSPEAVFIQAGIDNPYGHPVSEVVQRWQAQGAGVFSTENGKGFIIQIDREGFEIETMN